MLNAFGPPHISGPLPMQRMLQVSFVGVEVGVNIVAPFAIVFPQKPELAELSVSSSSQILRVLHTLSGELGPIVLVS